MSHKRCLSIALGLLVLLAIIFSPREYTTTWDFRGQQIPGRWDITSLTIAAPTNQGLHIKTETTGRMLHNTEFERDVDAVRLTYLATRHTDAIFYWHIRGTPKADLVQFPFTIRASTKPESMELNLGPYDQWDPRTDRVGFAFPAGTELLLQKVELLSWSPGAKVVEAMKTFWAFDALRPYSINFLWGPLLTHTSVAREQMFHRFPPLAYSANRIFYILLAAGLLVLLCLKKWKRNTPILQRRALIAFLGLLAALWLVYDLRMGSEFVNYFRTDYKTYHGETLGKRTFRTRGHFYDFARASVPVLADRDRYIFMAEQRWPYMGLMRYYTYPSVPTSPDKFEEVDTWLIYDRPDITINENRQLMMEGEAISTPGRILHEFSEGVFIFRKDT